jgi:hypothetical protein
MAAMIAELAAIGRDGTTFFAEHECFLVMDDESIDRWIERNPTPWRAGRQSAVGWENEMGQSDDRPHFSTVTEYRALRTKVRRTDP